MRTRRLLLAAALAALLPVAVVGCVVTPPATTPPTTTPPTDPAPTDPDPAAIIVASAWQSDGPLGDGTEGVERTDATALADLAEVLELPDTEREDIECVWSTSTSVDVTYDGGGTATFTAEACGATGRDAALGRLVAEWAAAG